MANTLMFEVGVQEAKGQLTALENRLEELVKKYGSMKIKVEVDQLENFVKALKSIGNGEQLKPLLDRIDSLQTSLTKINGAMGNVDMSSLKKQLDAIAETEARIKKTKEDLTAKGQSSYISTATKADDIVLKNQINTLERNFGMTVEAAKHYIKTSETASDTSSKLNQKIEQLSQSISTLASKTPTINLGGDFNKWAQEVNGVTTAVKELVEQLKQLKQAEPKQLQGGIFDTTKFNTLQEAIDKIIGEINRLKEAFAGIGKIEGIDALKTTINGLQVEVGNLVSAMMRITGALHIDKSAEEIAATEKKIAELRTQYEQLQQQVTATGNAAKVTNTEMKTIGESKGSEATMNKNLDKLQAALEKINANIATVQPKYDVFKAAGLSDQELEGKYNRLIKIREAIEGAMGNKDLLAKPGALSSIKLAGEDIMALGEMTKELRSAKGAEKLAADFERVATNAEIAKKAMQGLPSMQVDKGDKAIEEYVAQNKNVLTKWREFVRDNMKALHADIREGFTGMDKSSLWEMYRNLRQKFGEINKQVTGDTLQDPQKMIPILQQYRSLIMEINSSRIQQGGVKQGWADANEYRMREAAVAYAYLKERIDGFIISREKLNAAGQDTTALDNMIQKAREFLFIFDKMRTNGFYGDLRLGDILKSAEFRTIAPNGRDEIKRLTEQTKQAAQAEKEEAKAKKEQANAAAQADKENKKWADSMGLAKTKATELKNKIQELDSVEKKLNAKGIDTTELRAAIDQMRQNLSILQGMAAGSKIYGTSQDFTSRSNAQYQTPIIEANATAKRLNAQATQQLSSEEQRLANAICHSSGEMKNQSQILSDLKMMAMQYVSVWSAQGFIKNIIEVGGQLEKQRLSIGAILGDISHANDLFGKIKDLAVKSPFGVVELDQFTKQLSAYGFKYNELYDMTKRLADISAGAGTDVSRLTLAIGHVRAEGALTGYTLRQFAMNNIPMVSELAKKLSEVEHRIVTVADVRKRVRNKEIGYEDVIDVIKNLTNEGGMFYNMQETISQSIQSRFKNLRDSLDIMYGEIAESRIGDALKGLAVTLTELSRSWKQIVPIIESAVIAWASYKAATIAANMTIGSNTAAITANMLAYKKKRAEELLHESMVRKLTEEEIALYNTRNRLTAENIRVAMSTNAMTKADALRLVALRKVDLETTKALIHMGAFSAAEARMALNGRLLGMNLGRAGAAIKMFGTSAIASLGKLGGSLFTGWNAAFAALTIGMSAKQRQDEFNEIREQRRNAINERANEGYKNLLEATKNFSVGSSANMTKTDINLSLDEMIEKLKEYSMYYNTTFNDAFKVNEQGYAIHSLAEQYEILAKGLEDAANAHKMFSEMRDLVTHSIETSDPGNGFWKNVGDTMYRWLMNDDAKAKIGSLSDSLEHFAETTRNVGIAENMLLRDHIALRTALDGRGLGDVMNMSNEELIRTLSRLRSTMPEVFSAVRLSLSAESRAMLDDWTAKCNSMNDAYAVSNLKMRKAGNDLYESMKVKFGSDMTKWPSEWREFVFMAMDAATKDVKGFSDMSVEYQNLVRDSFLKPFKISVDSDEAKEKVNDLYTDLQNLVGKTWTIKIGVKGESAWEDLETSGKKYQEADKKVKQLEKNLKRLNYVPGSYLNSRQAEKVAEEYNDAIAERRASKILYESYGGDVSELDKNKKKSSGKGSQEDKPLKAAKNRLDEMKAFLSEYKKYYAVYGKEKSIDMLEKLFPLTKGRGKDIVDNYTKVIQEILDDIDRSTEERKKFYLQGEKLITDTFFDRDKEALDRQMKEMEEYMSDSLEKYDLYKTLLEKTGDKDFAMNAFSNGQVWSDMAKNLADVLREKMGDKATLLDWDADKQSAEDWFKKNFNNGEELYKMWEKIIELIRGDYKKALTDAADAMKDSMTYDERIASIRAKYRDKNKNALSDRERYAYNKAENAEIAQVELDKLKDTINWDAVFGNLKNYSKNVLIGIRKSIKDFLAQNKQNMDVRQIKDIEDAIVNLDDTIADKSGLFSGLSKNIQAYIDAVKELTEAEEEYNKAVSQYGEGSIQAQDALKKLNQARYNVTSTEAGVRNSGDKTMDKMSKLASSLATLGKKEGASLSEIGSVAGTLISTLSSTNTAIGNLIAAILSLLDAIGNDPMGFAENIGRSIGNGIFGVNSLLNPVGNIYKELHGNAKIFGDNWFNDQMYDMYSMAWMKSADYSEYEKAKENYEALISVWDDLISRKREYLNESWGTEAANAAKESIRLLQSEIEQTQILARAALGGGSSTWSHSVGYRMWEGSYQYNGQNWKDVAGEISRSLGVTFNSMEDMTKMSSQQLLWIKENYSGLWAMMDDDFKSALENLIKYGESIDDILDTVDEKLHGLTMEGLVDSYYNFVTSAENANDVLADDLESKLKEAIVKGMIENLYQERINALLAKSTELGKNDRYVDKNGNIRTHSSNPENDRDVASEYTAEEYALIKQMAETLGEEERNTYNMLKEMYGWSDESSSSTMGTSIKGVTEQTADLLASYVNAIRADVSVNRAMIAEYFPMYYAALTSSNSSLAGIESNTRAIMQSNSAIMESNSEMRDILRRVTQGGDKLRVS